MRLIPSGFMFSYSLIMGPILLIVTEGGDSSGKSSAKMEREVRSLLAESPVGTQ